MMQTPQLPNIPPKPRTFAVQNAPASEVYTKPGKDVAADLSRYMPPINPPFNVAPRKPPVPARQQPYDLSTLLGTITRHEEEGRKLIDITEAKCYAMIQTNVIRVLRLTQFLRREREGRAGVLADERLAREQITCLIPPQRAPVSRSGSTASQQALFGGSFASAHRGSNSYGSVMQKLELLQYLNQLQETSRAPHRTSMTGTGKIVVSAVPDGQPKSRNSPEDGLGRFSKSNAPGGEPPKGPLPEWMRNRGIRISGEVPLQEMPIARLTVALSAKATESPSTTAKVSPAPPVSPAPADSARSRIPASPSFPEPTSKPFVHLAISSPKSAAAPPGQWMDSPKGNADLRGGDPSPVPLDRTMSVLSVQSNTDTVRSNPPPPFVVHAPFSMPLTSLTRESTMVPLSGSQSSLTSSAFKNSAAAEWGEAVRKIVTQLTAQEWAERYSLKLYESEEFERMRTKSKKEAFVLLVAEEEWSRGVLLSTEERVRRVMQFARNKSTVSADTLMGQWDAGAQDIQREERSGRVQIVFLYFESKERRQIMIEEAVLRDLTPKIQVWNIIAMRTRQVIEYEEVILRSFVALEFTNVIGRAQLSERECEAFRQIQHEYEISKWQKEVSSLKGALTNLKSEFTNEISRISRELEEEKSRKADTITDAASQLSAMTFFNAMENDLIAPHNLTTGGGKMLSPQQIGVPAPTMELVIANAGTMPIPRFSRFALDRMQERGITEYELACVIGESRVLSILQSPGKGIKYQKIVSKDCGALLDKHGNVISSWREWDSHNTKIEHYVTVNQRLWKKTTLELDEGSSLTEVVHEEIIGLVPEVADSDGVPSSYTSVVKTVAVVRVNETVLIPLANEYAFNMESILRDLFVSVERKDIRGSTVLFQHYDSDNNLFYLEVPLYMFGGSVPTTAKVESLTNLSTIITFTQSTRDGMCESLLMAPCKVTDDNVLLFHHDDQLVQIEVQFMGKRKTDFIDMATNFVTLHAHASPPQYHQQLLGLVSREIGGNLEYLLHMSNKFFKVANVQKKKGALTQWALCGYYGMYLRLWTVGVALGNRIANESDLSSFLHSQRSLGKLDLSQMDYVVPNWTNGGLPASWKLRATEGVRVTKSINEFLGGMCNILFRCQAQSDAQSSLERMIVKERGVVWESRLQYINNSWHKCVKIFTSKNSPMVRIAAGYDFYEEYLEGGAIDEGYSQHRQSVKEESIEQLSPIPISHPPQTRAPSQFNFGGMPMGMNSSMANHQMPQSIMPTLNPVQLQQLQMQQMQQQQMQQQQMQQMQQQLQQQQMQQMPQIMPNMMWSNNGGNTFGKVMGNLHPTNVYPQMQPMSGMGFQSQQMSPYVYSNAFPMGVMNPMNGY